MGEWTESESERARGLRRTDYQHRRADTADPPSGTDHSLTLAATFGGMKKPRAGEGAGLGENE